MLGVAADGHTDMAVSEAVVDLQLVMLKVAAQSPRKETILDPFPQVLHNSNAQNTRCISPCFLAIFSVWLNLRQVFDARDRNKLILDPECRDFAKLNSIVTSMPPSEYVAERSPRGISPKDTGECLVDRGVGACGWTSATNMPCRF